MASPARRLRKNRRGRGQSCSEAFGYAPTSRVEKLRHPHAHPRLPRIPWKPPSQSQVDREPARAPLPGPSPTPLAPPLPAPGPRRSLARAHREPGRERKMSFPAARWRCQLIGRGRGPHAGLGASLAAAGAQLSGKNWGGCCGEISYRSLGGAAGPRSALTAAHPGPARWAGVGGGPLPPLLPPPPGHPPPLPSSPRRPALLSHSFRRSIDPRRPAWTGAPSHCPRPPITRPPRPRALLRGNPRAGPEEGRTPGVGQGGSRGDRAAGAEGGSRSCP